MKHLIPASLLCLTLPACASIVEGSSQKINLSTNPPAQLTCDTSNSRGSWKTPATPGVVDVKRSKSALVITCENAEYKGQLTNSSDIESWAAGNLLLGGLIGAAIDAGTGALFSYDDAMIVPLVAKSATAPSAVELAPAPAATPSAATGNYNLSPTTITPPETK